MHFNDEEVLYFKKWIIARLENISDADSDVLADYVLALLKSEAPNSQVRQNCLENLEDFLREHTSRFVNDAFTALDTKSFLPASLSSTSSHIPPTSHHPPTTQNATLPTLSSSTPTSTVPITSDFSASSAPEISRKRGFPNRDPNSLDPQDDRSTKITRRIQNHPSTYNHLNYPTSDSILPYSIPNTDQNSIASTPTSSSTFTPPPFDPNNPLLALLTMQAFGFPSFPLMPLMPSPTNSQTPPAFDPTLLQFTQSFPPLSSSSKLKKPRCHDFDTKGFCTFGATCPFNHSPLDNDTSDEYDPANSSLPFSHHKSYPPYRNHRSTDPSDHPRGTPRLRPYRNTRGAYLTNPSQNSHHDRSNTALFVENIPDEKFQESSIHNFFSAYGPIANIKLLSSRNTAIISFETHDAASQAFRSPKSVFDNRFVKVNWYRKDPTLDSATAINVEELAQKQVEAQRAFEEKQVKLRDAEARREEIEQKLREQGIERKLLLEKLAQRERALALKSGSVGTPSPVDADPSTEHLTPSSSTQATADGETPVAITESSVSVSKETQALRAKLKELEDEAMSMGINPNVETTPYTIPYQSPARGFNYFSTRSRGRGSFRARARYSRGGSGFLVARASSVRRLDNRPKKIAVRGVQFGTEQDEMLRQFLFNNFEFEGVEPHPEQRDVQIISFKERYVAENFIQAASVIPKIGPIELSWYTGVTSNSVPAITATSTSTSTTTTTLTSAGVSGGTVHAVQIGTFDSLPDTRPLSTSLEPGVLLPRARSGSPSTVPLVHVVASSSTSVPVSLAGTSALAAPAATTTTTATATATAPSSPSLNTTPSINPDPDPGPCTNPSHRKDVIPPTTVNRVSRYNAAEVAGNNIEDYDVADDKDVWM